MSSVIIAGDTSGTITLAAPAVAGSSVLTLPVATDTLVGKATTDTLTNKTLTSPVLDTAVTGTAVATQAQQETASATNVLVTPGRQQFHPSAAKAWVRFDTAGTINASYNVSSVTDTGAGDFTANWTVSFSSTNYFTSGSAIDQSAESAANTFIFKTHTQNTGSTRIFTQNASAGVRVDPSVGVCVAAFGDQ
jgi:hypothetical protein